MNELGLMAPKKRASGASGGRAKAKACGPALPQLDGGTTRRFRELRAKILGTDGHTTFRAANFMAPVNQGNQTCSSFDLQKSKTKMAAGEPAVFLGNMFGSMARADPTSRLEPPRLWQM